MCKRSKVKDLLINVHTSSSYRNGILITTPSFNFLTTNIAEIQQILWILLFLGRLGICRFYRSKQFLTPKLVDQKKLNVKLYLWTHVQFLVQDVLGGRYLNIVHTCWWKTQKNIVGKNIFVNIWGTSKVGSMATWSSINMKYFNGSGFSTIITTLVTFPIWAIFLENIFIWVQNAIIVKERCAKIWRLCSKTWRKATNFFWRSRGKVQSFLRKN